MTVTLFQFLIITDLFMEIFSDDDVKHLVIKSQQMIVCQQYYAGTDHLYLLTKQNEIITASTTS